MYFALRLYVLGIARNDLCQNLSFFDELNGALMDTASVLRSRGNCVFLSFKLMKKSSKGICPTLGVTVCLRKLSIPTHNPKLT